MGLSAAAIRSCPRWSSGGGGFYQSTKPCGASVKKKPPIGIFLWSLKKVLAKTLAPKQEPKFSIWKRNIKCSDDQKDTIKSGLSPFSFSIESRVSRTQSNRWGPPTKVAGTVDACRKLCNSACFGYLFNPAWQHKCSLFPREPTKCKTASGGYTIYKNDSYQPDKRPPEDAWGIQLKPSSWSPWRMRCQKRHGEEKCKARSERFADANACGNSFCMPAPKASDDGDSFVYELVCFVDHRGNCATCPSGYTPYQFSWGRWKSCKGNKGCQRNAGEQ